MILFSPSTTEKWLWDRPSRPPPRPQAAARVRGAAGSSPSTAGKPPRRHPQSVGACAPPRGRARQPHADFWGGRPWAAASRGASGGLLLSPRARSRGGVAICGMRPGARLPRRLRRLPSAGLPGTQGGVQRCPWETGAGRAAPLQNNGSFQSPPSDGGLVTMTTTPLLKVGAGARLRRSPRRLPSPSGPAVWCVWRWQLLSKEGTSLSPGDERNLVFITTLSLRPTTFLRALHPVPRRRPWMREPSREPPPP